MNLNIQAKARVLCIFSFASHTVLSKQNSGYSGISHISEYPWISWYTSGYGRVSLFQMWRTCFQMWRT